MHTHFLRWAFAAALLASPSLANNGGIFGYSGNPATNGGGTCAGCHTGGVAPIVTLSGPQAVLGDETNTYIVTIAGGQAQACGFDAAASSGELFVIEAGTRLFVGEVTHDGPRLVDGGGVCTYTFDWTSPVAAGIETLYVSGNSVSLDQTVAGDASATVALSITVDGALPGMLPPIADADGPYGAVLGGAITFDGTASFDPDGTVVAWNWDFGDGNVAGGATPSHTYAAEGSYTVTLTVTDDQARVDQDTTTATVVAQPGAIKAVRVLQDPALVKPTWITAPAGDPRLFIVLQGQPSDPLGRVLILANGALLPTPFLEMPVGVQNDLGGDYGMRGLVFAPDYATSGLFYVLYSRPGDLATTVSRFRVDPTNPDLADVASQEQILAVVPPAIWDFHLGSHLEFAPNGLLYIALGETGLDPQFAQDDSTLWGKMLRIDVSGGLGSGYTIPPSNPFVGPGDPLDEIWAKGFRNPYRFSIDPLLGDLYIGDVGQAVAEEIDVESAASFGGLNYGWNVKEGLQCPSGAPECSDGSFTDPVLTYPHGPGCAVIGGSLYRGVIPGFDGRFFFADWCTGVIQSFEWDGAGGVIDLRDHSAELIPNVGSITNPSAIGRDGFGELYVLDFTGGEVFRILSTLPDMDADAVPDSLDNCPATPNSGQGDADNDGLGDACDSICANGLDDDADGLIDFGDDPGCASSADADERGPQWVCDDGIDNDADGLVDFRLDAGGDPGCGSPFWPAEDPECSDGLDNDQDGRIDFDGGLSSLPPNQQTAPDVQCLTAFQDREAAGRGCGLGFEAALLLLGIFGWRSVRERRFARMLGSLPY
ncbi:MAG: PQQ-dependent sugar dehydrogenase [Deltaproteobacteria bacterium]|nr:PQQ-dependent sugar dehydrogenase [Deltaproteobacteria bacterium]